MELEIFLDIFLVGHIVKIQIAQNKHLTNFNILITVSPTMRLHKANEKYSYLMPTQKKN